jgi:NAD(P)-dependent dehydrogenase (short-subunit alcohol dehydrogenase family)
MESWMLDGFAGRWAVVTGGADGIGRSMAAAFGAHGMRVALLDVRHDAAVQTAEELTGAGRGLVIAVACDVTDAGSLAHAAEAVRAQCGSIAILAANAGVGAAGGLLSASDNNLNWVLGVNVHGLIQTARHFAPLFDPSAAGPRHLLVSASSASLQRVDAPGLALYAASKHCTMGIAEGLAAELAPQGIGTTILCPGLINTSIWNGARARPDRFGGARELPEDVGENWRTNGMDVDWVAREAMAAIDAGAPYCAPIEAHKAGEFDARADAIRSGFRFPGA